MEIKIKGLALITFIVFLILKLTGAISWSWWWVTSPIWIYLSIWLTVVFIVMVAAFVCTELEKVNERKTRKKFEEICREKREKSRFMQEYEKCVENGKSRRGMPGDN